MRVFILSLVSSFFPGLLADESLRSAEVEREERWTTFGNEVNQFISNAEAADSENGENLYRKFVSIVQQDRKMKDQISGKGKQESVQAAKKGMQQIFGEQMQWGPPGTVLCQGMDPHEYCDGEGDCGGSYCQCEEAYALCDGRSYDYYGNDWEDIIYGGHEFGEYATAIIYELGYHACPHAFGTGAWDLDYICEHYFGYVHHGDPYYYYYDGPWYPTPYYYYYTTYPWYHTDPWYPTAPPTTDGWYSTYSWYSDWDYNSNSWYSDWDYNSNSWYSDWDYNSNSWYSDWDYNSNSWYYV